MAAAVTPTRSSSTPVPPARTPDARRKFQLTEFGDNHNKWWQVEVWDLGGGAVHMRTTWGRVGATPSHSSQCSVAGTGLLPGGRSSTSIQPIFPQVLFHKFLCINRLEENLGFF